MTPETVGGVVAAAVAVIGLIVAAIKRRWARQEDAQRERDRMRRQYNGAVDGGDPGGIVLHRPR